MPLIFSLSYFPFSITRGNIPITGEKIFYAESMSYFTDNFTTTDHKAHTSYASGWGNGAITKERNIAFAYKDYFATTNPITALAVQDRFVYANGYDDDNHIETLLVFNLSDPTDIQLTSHRDSLIGHYSLEVDGDKLYAGCIWPTLQSINTYNVTDIHNLHADSGVYCSFIDKDGEVTDIDPEGHIVYYTAYDSVTNNSLCRMICHDPLVLDDTPINWNSNQSLGIDVEFQTAYVAASVEGFYILDISDYTAPIELGHVDTPGNATDVIVNGDYAYLADSFSGVHIINITDSANPVICGSYDTPGDARRLKLQGNTLLVADGEGGVQVLDVADKSNPCFAFEINTLPYTWDIDIYGETLIVGTDDGLYTYRLRGMDEFNEFLSDHYENGFDLYECWDVEVIGQIAYVAAGPDGLYTLDVSDPSAPKLLDIVDDGILYRKIDIKDDYALIADCHIGGSIRMYDISDPTNIFQTDSIALSYATDVVVSGDIVWIAAGSSGLYSLNISNPYSLSMLSVPISLNNATALWVQGYHLYIVEDLNGANVPALHCVDIRDPENPDHVSSVTLISDMYDIIVDNDLVFVASDDYFKIYNYTNPYSPYEIRSIATTATGGFEIYGLCKLGPYIICSTSNHSYVVDTSDLPQLATAYGYSTFAGALQVKNHGDYVYIANRSSLAIVRFFESAADIYTHYEHSSITSTDITGVLLVPIESATFYVDDYVPNGTSVTYYLSVDNGYTYESVTPGVLHEFTAIGHDLQWKAEFSGPTDRSVHIYDVRISYYYNLIPTAPVLEISTNISSTGIVTLTFSASEDDDTIDHYELQMSKFSTFDEILDDWNLVIHSKTVYNLEHGIRYFFRVRAVDEHDLPGDWSQIVYVDVDIKGAWPFSFPPIVLGGIIGGSVIVLAIVIVVPILVVRRRKKIPT